MGQNLKVERGVARGWPGGVGLHPESGRAEKKGPARVGVGYGDGGAGGPVVKLLIGGDIFVQCPERVDSRGGKGR